jgi:hypothetical protein
LFDGVVLAVRSQDGTIWLCLNDLCDVLHLKLQSQRRRIQRDPRLHLQAFLVARGNQVRPLDCIRNDDLATWIMIVPANQIGANSRERFGYVQQYLTAAVARAFTELTGLPADAGQQIEDLTDLDLIEPAFVTLEEFERRQGASEARNEAAHEELTAQLADLRVRLNELAHEMRLRVSPEQRFTIHNLVTAWAEARATQSSTPVGPMKHQCWKQVNAAFGVTTYADLPAARFDEIVRYLKDCYREVTGKDIDVIRQERLL